MRKKVKVSPATNGFILEVYGEKTVWKEDDLYSMLWHIHAMLEPMDSGKYSEKRIYITRAHGHKYDCNKKNCVLCKRLDAIYDFDPTTDED